MRDEGWGRGERRWVDGEMERWDLELEIGAEGVSPESGIGIEDLLIH